MSSDTNIYVIMRERSNGAPYLLVSAHIDQTEALKACQQAETAAKRAGGQWDTVTGNSWRLTYNGEIEHIHILAVKAVGTLGALARMSESGLLEVSQDEGTMNP